MGGKFRCQICLAYLTGIILANSDQSPLLGLTIIISPVGFTLAPELSELMVLEVSGLSWPNTGERKDMKEEIHVAGFLTRILKSNFEFLLGALDRAGTETRKNPSKVIRATALKRRFLDIGTSFQ